MTSRYAEKRPSILIIEDQEELRSTITEALNEYGFHAIGVACGKEGLKTAKKGRFDGLILDLRLPGISGWEILQELNQQSLPPILLLTSSDSAFDSRTAEKLGVMQHLTKPFDLNYLLEATERLISHTFMQK